MVTDSAGDRGTDPRVDELERQATSACLTGADDDTDALWIRAHNECLKNEDAHRAARCIFWLVLDLFNRGEWARGNGWLARGLHLLQHTSPGSALGLLSVLEARNHLRQGDVEAAGVSANRAWEIAIEVNDLDLNVFSRLALALVLTRRGQFTEAASLFDEIMVGVTVDHVSPIAVGVVYCAVIDACHSRLDIGRAREWTAALDRWCQMQPRMVAFQGKCMVHRTEILRQSGDWTAALAEAEQACAWSGAHANSFRYPAGAAFYELAEIHRLRGDMADAEAAYLQAGEKGHAPEPGLTRLLFAQNRREAAVASIRRLLSERSGGAARPETLLVAVEMLIAVGDLPAARIALDELLHLADQFQSLAVRAMAAHARGMMHLSDGDLPAASGALRDAWKLWQDLEVPYEAARVRVTLGQVCRQMGDEVAANSEFDGARRFFARVSAEPDVARVDALQRGVSVAGVDSLTARERQVIELVATGRTNRAIAQALSISERTVDRHVSNILMKLNLPSRSAATAYAYQNDLVGPTG